MWKLSQYSFHSRAKTFQGEQQTGQLQLDLTFVPGASGHASRMPFFDVRVTNPKAHLHSASEVQHHLLSHEQQKKRQYGLRVTTIDRGSFTPLVFATKGMVGKECERFLKTLVGRVVEKNGDLRYSVVMNHLRTKLTMSILRWNITCFRGCRSSYTRKKSSLFVTQCRLLCPK